MTTGENFRSFYSIIIDGNDVYRAYCDSIDSVGFHSGYFKNTVEHQLPILDGAYPAATSILKSDNDLYLSGIYIKEQAWEGGYWKNDEWHKVALPSNLQSSIVYSVVVK